MTEKILCNPCRWAEVKVDEKTERDAILTRGMELTGSYMKLASEKVKKNAWVVSAVDDSDPSWQGYEFGIVRASGSLIKLPSRVVQHGAANLEALTLAFKGQYTDRHTRDGTTSNEHFVLWRDPSRATASHPTFWFAAANVRQVFETWGPETVGGLVTGEVTIWRLHDRQKAALAKVPLRLEPRAVTPAPAADAAASTSESETVAASSGQHPVGTLVLVAIKHYGLWPAEVADPYSPKVGSSVHKARGRNTILLKTWEAAYHCASLGKKLVKPISEDSNRAVMTALETGTNTDAWIGLSNNVFGRTAQRSTGRIGMRRRREAGSVSP